MLDHLAVLFNSDDFLPHGHCFLWIPEILWLHVVSDLIIGVSYFSIPLAILYFARKRRNLPFRSIFVLSGIFILLCGTTHFLSVWVLWNPDYGPEGIVKAMTALVSAVTAVAAWKIMPLALEFTGQKQLERQSQEEANRLKTVMDTVLDGLITIDARGNIQSFNRAAVRIFGYQTDEVIGQNVKMLMPEPYHSGHDGYLKNYLTTGNAKVIDIGREVAAKRRDGSVFPMELGVNEMSIGGQRMFVGTIRDITARREAEEKTGLLAAIVQSSDDAILSKTLDGVITSWNIGAERLFGYTADEAIGQHIDFIIPRERWDEERQIIAQLHAGKSIEHFETVRAAKNGRLIDVSLTVSPLRDAAGNIIGASKLLRDITQLKFAEEQLLNYTHALERSNQELDDFAYIASHDLKEPLRGVSTNALFLKEDSAEKLDVNAQKRLGRMIYLCERMERLVNDLLYFSRLGRTDLAVQETDLNAIIRDIEMTMETTLREQNARITIPQPLPTITCDLPRVTEVYRNLISNAVKYNDKGEKRIEVGCTISPKAGRGENPLRVFYVKDNGIGIAKEFHEEVFRIFRRLNQEDDSAKGTGVGLTFVKKIIERHHGRIWLESEPDVGSTFYFTLDETKGK